MFWKFKTVRVCKKQNRTWYSSFSNKYLKPPWRVLFFGNDNFSLFSLKLLNEQYKSDQLLSNLEVVSSLKSKKNVVEEFATKNRLVHHSWPPNLKDDIFDLGIVVSFGNLIPKSIINKCPLGILNVHASLLPRWRGAAPIIHAIANGDKTTGVTIMKIKPDKFDIGDIVAQKEIVLEKDITVRDLHDKLARLGAELLLQVLKELPKYLQKARPQPKDGVTYAPKIDASMAYVRWEDMTSEQVYNLWRALTGLRDLVTVWNGNFVKLLDVKLSSGPPNIGDDFDIGSVYFDKPTKRLLVKCKDQKWISVSAVKVVGNKVMSAADFNNGYVKKLPEHLQRFMSVSL